MNTQRSSIQPYATGGPQRDRDKQQLGSIGSSPPRNQRSIERDHIDLKVPINRAEIPFASSSSGLEQTTDVLAAKTKIAELQKHQDCLKDTIQRLSEELARYQAKYPPLDKQEQLHLHEKLGTLTLPPWLFSSEHMNPLLVAYDSRIYELERENAFLKERVTEMTNQIRTLVQENDSLNEKIAKIFATKVKQSETGTISDVIDSASVGGINLEEWRDAQERMRLLEEENNVLIEENTGLRHETERLREEARKNHNNFASATMESDVEKSLLRNARIKLKEMQNERDAAFKQAQTHAQRISQMQSQLNSLNSALQSTAARNHELEQIVSNYMNQLASHERERERYSLVDKTNKKLESDLQEYSQQIKHLEIEILNLQSDRERFLREIKEQEQRLVVHQTSEFEALQKVDQSAELIENLKVERDSARKLSDNQRAEIDRLERKIVKLSEEHSERCRQVALETQEKEQYTISSLREEVRHVQMENAHMKAQIDRLEREKKTAENEVQHIIKAAESDHLANPALISELNRKISFANTERDEAERMYENLRTAQKRQVLQWEQEREQMHAQITETMKRMYKMEKDLQEERENNKRLIKEIDITQKRIQNLEFEKQELERSAKDHLNDVHDTHRLQVRDLNRRLQEANEKLSQSERDIQQLQIRCEELEMKHKTEVKKISDMSERGITDLRYENERLLKRNTELSEKLNLLVKERAELARLRDELEEDVTRFRQQYEATKTRADQNATQIKVLLEKEAELLRERKDLHLQLDRRNMEAERLQRDRESLVRKITNLERETIGSSSSNAALMNLYPFEETEERLFMSRQGTSLPSRRKFRQA